MADERLQARLAELRREYAVGESRLRDLLQQESALRETLLRISGAIQVLEELAAEPEPAQQAGEGDQPHVLTVP
ncbi:hypothetical protein ACWDA3_28140 [Nonomuraea rubra]